MDLEHLIGQNFAYKHKEFFLLKDSDLFLMILLNLHWLQLYVFFYLYLAKMKRVLGKRNKNAPHHSWLVIDGSTGTNGIEQARVFNEKFGLTGLVVTKLDGTSKGGALVAIYRELKIPIFYVGLGESPDDLQPFSVDQYLDSILPEMKLEVVN